MFNYGHSQKQIYTEWQQITYYALKTGGCLKWVNKSATRVYAGYYTVALICLKPGIIWAINVDIQNWFLRCAQMKSSNHKLWCFFKEFVFTNNAKEDFCKKIITCRVFITICKWQHLFELIISSHHTLLSYYDNIVSVVYLLLQTAKWINKPVGDWFARF